MQTLGIILMAVGAILFFGAKVMYKKNERQALKYKKEKSNSDSEFLALVNNGAIVLRIIGMILVIAGSIFIIFMN